MLSNERYNKAVEALCSLGDLTEEEAEINRQALLDQQFLTQRALENLGVVAETQPADVPGINQVYFPTVDVVYDDDFFEVFEIGGMPGAGKTSSIDKIREKIGIIPLGESWQKIPKHLRLKGVMSYRDLEKWKISGQGAGLERLFEQIEEGQISKAPILADRNWADSIAFLRAMLLSGRIEAEVFNPTHKFIASYFEPLPPPYTIKNHLIMCLIHPKLALARKQLSEKPGRFANPSFLYGLYQQYLRLHWEFISRPRTISYACLDFSIGSVKENAELLKDTIERMLKDDSRP